MGRQADGKAGRQAGRQADGQAGRQAGWQAGRRAGRQTGRQADGQAGSQAGRLAQQEREWLSCGLLLGIDILGASCTSKSCISKRSFF